MANLKSMYVVPGLLTVFLVAAGSHDGPNLDASYPNVVTLASLHEEGFGAFGLDVESAGDVNRDGFPDVIVSDIAAERAYIFSGPNGDLLYELISPDGNDGDFGASVAGAGDVDRDGFTDVIVGARQEGIGGRAYVFSGADARLLFALVSPNEESGGFFGVAVAGAGDVNQDGLADVIVGASFEGVGGRAYVFSGQDGSFLLELVSANEQQNGRFGTDVASAGDVSQDGVADVIVGAYLENEHAGRAYVFSGQDGGLLLELVSPNEQDGGNFGDSVAGAGDVNRDGFDDLVVGAQDEPPTGHAYVFSGQDGKVLFEPMSPLFRRTSFGSDVAGAGDVDQDGFPDVIVGDERAKNDFGRAHVFSGQDGRPILELASPNPESNGFFGYSVSNAGDFNQDGLPDFIVGAIGEDPGSSPERAGRAHVFLSSGRFHINSGGPDYTDTNGSLFVADRPFSPGSFGYVGGLEHRFNQPIGGTDDDSLYQDVRIALEAGANGTFSYRFDVASPARYDVTLYLMAPALDSAGNVVMDIQAEEDLAFDDLDVTAEAGGEYQALVKIFEVDVTDGRLDLRFRAVNKAAVVSAIAVAAQTTRAMPPGRRGGVR